MQLSQCQPGGHALSARRKFGGYKRETPKVVRTATVTQNLDMGPLTDALEHYSQTTVPVYDVDKVDLRRFSLTTKGGFKFALSEIEGLEFTAKHVEALSVIIPTEFPAALYRGVGFFFSALVSQCPNEDFIISTANMAVELNWHMGPTLVSRHGQNYFATLNAKNVEIKGDVGHFFGALMTGGRLVLDGNAGEDVGHFMSGGEIHINGDYKTIGDVLGGKIFHKGKLIVDK